jgi:hypothetical protein
MWSGVFQNYKWVIPQKRNVLLFQPLSIALDNNVNYYIDMPHVSFYPH